MLCAKKAGRNSSLQAIVHVVLTLSKRQGRTTAVQLPLPRGMFIPSHQTKATALCTSYRDGTDPTLPGQGPKPPSNELRLEPVALVCLTRLPPGSPAYHQAALLRSTAAAVCPRCGPCPRWACPPSRRSGLGGAKGCKEGRCRCCHHRWFAAQGRPAYGVGGDLGGDLGGAPAGRWAWRRRR